MRATDNPIPNALFPLALRVPVPNSAQRSANARHTPPTRAKLRPTTPPKRNVQNEATCHNDSIAPQPLMHQTASNCILVNEKPRISPAHFNTCAPAQNETQNYTAPPAPSDLLLPFNRSHRSN